MAMPRPAIGLARTPYPRRSIPMAILCHFDNILVNDAALTPLQLRNLTNHKYSAEDCGILNNLFMNKFWNQLVLQFPLWLAPNLITLIGLLCNVTAVGILAWFSPDGIGKAPWWSYLLCAVMLFIYQSLDAIDGKQARRTNSASPMGELFDHGCDSLSQIFVSMEICLSIQYGYYPYFMLLICIFAISMFYLAHWQAYVCGSLKFGQFDVTEGQFCVMAVCLISCVGGPEIWATQVFGFEMKQLLLGWAIFPAGWTVICYIITIFSDGAGKYGSTIADTSVLSPLCPLLAFIFPPLIIYHKSSTDVFQQHLVLYCITFGLVGAKITNRLIVAHMCKSELTFWDIIYYVPALFMANQYCNTYIEEYSLLLFCFVLAAFILVMNAAYVCRQISHHMNISIFTIPHVEQDPLAPTLNKQT